MEGIELVWGVQWLGASWQAFLDVLFLCFYLICILYMKDSPNKLKSVNFNQNYKSRTVVGLLHNQIRLWPSSTSGTSKPMEPRRGWVCMRQSGSYMASLAGFLHLLSKPGP